MRTGKRLSNRLAARRGQEGIALPVALFTLAALLLVAASSLLVGAAGIKATRSYRGAAQVHFAAESAISESLQLINGPGVINFQNDVFTPWSGLWGTLPHNFAPLNGFSYNVQVQLGPVPADGGRLIATANGVEGVKNVVVATMVRGSIPNTAPGAIYLASDQNTNADFQGNNFQVDGNDHNFTGGMGPGTPVPGISTRNQVNTGDTVGALSGGQLDNVTGLGFMPGPPIVPSIMTSSAAPSVAQINQMANDLLARPGVVVNNNAQINGNSTFGTTLLPQITHFSQSTEIQGNGNASGAGILIVDGDLTINGSLDFKGLILVRGATVVGTTGVTGNATVYGTIWTNDVNLSIGGSAICYYSTQALALANQVGGGGALPSPMQLTSLIDCSEGPSSPANGRAEPLPGWPRAPAGRPWICADRGPAPRSAFDVWAIAIFARCALRWDGNSPARRRAGL